MSKRGIKSKQAQAVLPDAVRVAEEVELEAEVAKDEAQQIQAEQQRDESPKS